MLFSLIFSLRKYFIIIICAACLNNLFAQIPPVKFEHLSVEDGLSQSTVYAIAQDQKGFLWFGTSDGLNKYDGFSFTVFKNIPSDPKSFAGKLIYSLCASGSGKLWIGMRNGLDVYDPNTNFFNHHTSLKGDKNSLSNNYINIVFEDSKGIIWIGTGAGLNIYNPANNNFTQIHPDPKHTSDDIILTIYEDEQSNLWIGGIYGFYKYVRKANTFSKYSLPVFRGATQVDKKITGIISEKDNLYIGTLNTGFYKYSVSSNKFTHYTSGMAAKIFTGIQIAKMIKDNWENIWLGTTQGVVKFIPAKEEFSLYNHSGENPSSLSFDHVAGFFIDRSNQLWIGTDGGGVNKLNLEPKKFGLIAKDPENSNSLSDNFIKSIYEDKDGNLWVGSARGLNKLDKSSGKWSLFQLYPNSPNVIGNLVFKITDDRQGNLLIGTETSFSEFNKNSKKFTAHINKDIHTEDGFTVYSFREIDSSNIYWIASWYGLLTFDRSTAKYFRIPGDTIGNKGFSGSINAIFQDSKKMLWVGTLDSGIFLLNRKKEIVKHYFPVEGNPATISSYNIRCFYEDPHGNMWIGTTNGLNKLNTSTGKFSLFNENNGLVNSFIYGILPDDHGNLWLSTNKGLSKFNPVTNSFRNYEAGEGLQSNEFNSGAYFRSMNGLMYFGGIGGITFFHPDSITDNPAAPPVVITSFKKFDQPVEMGKDISTIKEITLNYNENVFSFQFAALDFTDPELNQYAYKMEGFDNEWIYPDRRREVRYTNLNDGEYVFRVKASNNDGVWNNKGVSVRIHILPPIWKRWWFITGLIVIAVLIIAGTVRYISFRKLKRKIEELEYAQLISKERSRISRDLHDVIGAHVTQISIFSELLKRDLVNKDISTSAVENITESAHDIAESLDGLVWAVNPENDSLENFIGYIEQYSVLFLEKAGIKCRLEIPVEFPEKHLPADIRHNVLMVIKESLTNIVKHAGASEVNLICSLSNQYLFLSLNDNGKGFIIENIRKYGNGLKNMKKRIESVHGNYDIASAPGKGTVTTLTIRLPG